MSYKCPNGKSSLRLYDRHLSPGLTALLLTLQITHVSSGKRLRRAYTLSSQCTHVLQQPFCHEPLFVLELLIYHLLSEISHQGMPNDINLTYQILLYDMSLF